MKLLQLAFILTILSFATSNPYLPCEDREGRFPIPELGVNAKGRTKKGSCRFVKRNINLCVESWTARTECIKTCGGCKSQTLICMDASGKFPIPELDDEERNCQYVRNKNIALCQSSSTVSARCPKTCGECGGDPGASLEEDMCVDDQGKFEISQLNNEKRNCQYVRNKNIDLCIKSGWVRTKCPRTCGLCGPNEGLLLDDVCMDMRGKFEILEIGEWRNCQHVKMERMALCDISDRVKSTCKKTCGGCN